jgi:hypothetical protein
MYYISVVVNRFLRVLCVLLSVHDCVDSSMVKYVLPNKFQLFMIKIHRLLEFIFFLAFSKSETC